MLIAFTYDLLPGHKNGNQGGANVLSFTILGYVRFFKMAEAANMVFFTYQSTMEATKKTTKQNVALLR